MSTRLQTLYTLYTSRDIRVVAVSNFRPDSRVFPGVVVDVVIAGVLT